MKEELEKEIKRVEELEVQYKAIGPEGFFGASMIGMSLKKAHMAETDEDIAEAVEDLKGITG